MRLTRSITAHTKTSRNAR